MAPSMGSVSVGSATSTVATGPEAVGTSQQLGSEVIGVQGFPPANVACAGVMLRLISSQLVKAVFDR